MSTRPATGAPRGAMRLIGALLRLYPRAFREDFGPAVRDLVERELASAAHGGRLALARALVSHAIDILTSALGQRLAPLLHGRDARGTGDGVVGAWSAWLRDSRYGARLLAKHRAFSAIVVVIMALAIGVNTVIFTFTNVLLLRPLPVREPETLGWVFASGPHAEGKRERLSMPDFLDVRAAARSFTALAARGSGTSTLSGLGDAERLATNEVTSDLFDVWGLAPHAGRLFMRGEDAPGAPPVVVLSHHFWIRRFGGDPAIVGRAITLDGASRTVIGVLDPAIEIGNLSTIDVWIPLALDPNGSARDVRWLAVVGRLAAGVTVAQASAEMREIAQRLQRDHPATNNGWDARVTATREAITGPNTWVTLAMLGMAVVFVLLIACANLANLMLVRSAERSREIAVRTALGASRGAIVRQLVVESLLIGAVGGAVGLAVAYAGLVLIKATAYEEIFAMLSIDRNVLLFVTSATILTSLLFSLAPAIQTSRADVSEILKGASSKASAGVRVRRGRAMLVVTQVALALSLTIVGVLIVRSMIKTARIDLGFDPRGLFAFRVDVPVARYPGTERLVQLYESALTDLAAIPGVQAAGLSTRLPVIDGDAPAPVSVEGRTVARPADQPWAATTVVGGAFFDAAGIPMLAGRAFARGDDASAPLVAIVNREMAERHWGAPAAAIGKRIALVGESERARRWLVVIGVSGDTRPDDITQSPNPQVYVPIAQRPARSLVFLLRAPRADALAAEVRAVMRRADGGLALYDARTVVQTLVMETSTNHVLTAMYVAFAAIALALAAAGLYGVMSYSVTQRTREMGIRVALGATAGDVRRMVLVQGGRFLVAGGSVGLVVGWLIASTMRSMLYGVSALDPATYGLVLGVIVCVMGLATYLPARRAMRVDPVAALRSE